MPEHDQPASDAAPEAPRRFATRDEISATRNAPRRTIDVHVPEWKAWVRLQSLHCDEYEEFEQVLSDSRRDEDSEHRGRVKATLVSRCAIDEQGNALFAPSDGDVPWLASLDHAPISRLWEAALKLNLAGEAAEENVKKN